MRVERKPEIGDTMFHVCEHLYYVPEHAAPLNEYCVCEATVVGFLKGGYTEVKLVGKNPGGFNAGNVVDGVAFQQSLIINHHAQSFRQILWMNHLNATADLFLEVVQQRFAEVLELHLILGVKYQSFHKNHSFSGKHSLTSHASAASKQRSQPTIVPSSVR